MLSQLNSPVKIEPADLPQTFHQSRRYRRRQTDAIWATEYVCNFGFRVRNYEDLSSLLETMRYWNFEITPTSYFDAIFSKKRIIKELMEENTKELLLQFPNFRPLYETAILVDDAPDEEKHRIALENGYYTLAEYLCQGIV
jgi:hypothetical protein